MENFIIGEAVNIGGYLDTLRWSQEDGWYTITKVSLVMVLC
jgi:hypothetical protein